MKHLDERLLEIEQQIALIRKAIHTLRLDLAEIRERERVLDVSRKLASKPGSITQEYWCLKLNISLIQLVYTPRYTSIHHSFICYYKSR